MGEVGRRKMRGGNGKKENEEKSKEKNEEKAKGGEKGNGRGEKKDAACFRKLQEQVELTGRKE